MARTTLSTLRWRVYNDAGELCGAIRHVEDAATLVSSLDEGGTIRDRDGFILWTEGEDGTAIATDIAAEVYERLAGRK
jgi:hypothetical protein